MTMPMAWIYYFYFVTTHGFASQRTDYGLRAQTPFFILNSTSRRVLVPAAYLKGARQTAQPIILLTTKYQRPTTTTKLFRSGLAA